MPMSVRKFLKAQRAAELIAARASRAPDTIPVIPDTPPSIEVAKQEPPRSERVKTQDLPPRVKRGQRKKRRRQ
jgi:hypothetical protein